MREYSEAQVKIDTVQVKASASQDISLSGDWIHIKTTVHYHAKGSFVIGKGQTVKYFVKLINW